MPQRRVKARLSGYKNRNRKGRKGKVSAFRKDVKKAKNAKTARKNRTLVKRYRTARILRQPTLALPDSQVVRMQYVTTINLAAKSTPFTYGLHGSPEINYTCLDTNKFYRGINSVTPGPDETGVTDTLKNTGPFGVPMGVLRLNDITKCVEGLEGKHQVSQYQDYGKFYRQWTVLGSNANVTYRFMYPGYDVETTDGQVTTFHRFHEGRTPPIMIWATQKLVDKDHDGHDEMYYNQNQKTWWRRQP
jgi:hypothetical protein